MSSWKKMKAARATEREERKKEGGGPRVISRGEVEEERRRKYLEDQRAAEEERAKRRQKWVAEAAVHAAVPSASGNTVAFMPRKEVIRRLRDRGEPATLFGEDDAQRRDRLQELISREVVLDDMADASGLSHQKELLKRAMEETLNANRQRLESGVTPEQAEEEERNRILAVIAEKEKALQERQGGLEVIDVANPSDKTLPSKSAPMAEVQQFVLMFMQAALLEWHLLLLRRPQEERKSGAGQREAARYEETVGYMQPLEKLLKKGTLSESLARPFMDMSFYAQRKEYVRAMEVYQSMAVGNAAWPLGVTQVGIHSRAGRERISTNKQAHILNSETQRKYIQGFKRLLTMVQKLHPTVSSNMVRDYI
eukprot:TRINITY_DN37580_c0_g1_i1.p1 TRINITY_DN37580_c0_g1~~TRINITY_DN37580_c0_g1_i1.p1  ORF type:complete len:367 (+),score=136.10 TRINITY_DN37580_c0_g1_i1:122-1222(+)